jgi:general secretion pathway protein D
LQIRAIFVCPLAAGILAAGEPSASDLFAKGRKAEKAGRMVEAYLLYSEASAKDSNNQEYWLKSQTIRPLAEMQAKPPLGPNAHALSSAGENEPQLEPATAQDLALLRKPLPPTELKAAPGVKDLDFTGDSRSLFQQVARAFALECTFDTDYQAGRSFRFRLTAADYRTALHAMEMATGSFLRPLSSTRFMVVKDTLQKRTEMEPVVAVEVVLPETATPDSFRVAATNVQQALALEHIGLYAQNNSIVIRDRISKALAARDMLQNFMRPRARVMVETRLLEIDHNDVVTYGLSLPTQFPLIALTSWANNLKHLSIPQAINGVLSFGGGKTLLGLGVMDAALIAQMSQSKSAVLLDSSIQAVDGEPATLHVGDRYPILQSAFLGASSSGAGNYIPAPQFSWVDLGLSLKITPTIHDSEETTLGIEAEYKVLTGGAVDGLPIISNRQINSSARMRFGEWAVIAGLMNGQQARTVAGLAGLSRVPVLRQLTSTHTKNTDDSDVLVLVRPYLITPPPSETPAYSFFLGSDTHPRTPL